MNDIKKKFFWIDNKGRRVETFSGYEPFIENCRRGFVGHFRSSPNMRPNLDEGPSRSSQRDRI